MSNEKKNDGGYAFPSHTSYAAYEVNTGMTLRDYFAAKAMQQIIGDERFVLGYDPDQVADRAYEYADAMIKAREQ